MPTHYNTRYVDSLLREKIMGIEFWTSFLGWCSVLNIGLLLVSTISVTFLKHIVSKLHSRMLGVEKSQLPPIYMQFLANYKLAIIVLNIVPYIALRIMG